MTARKPAHVAGGSRVYESAQPCNVQQPLRVVMVGLETPMQRPGGLNRYFLELARALRREGVSVEALALGDANREADQDGLVIVGSSAAPIWTRLRCLRTALVPHDEAEILDIHFALTGLAGVLRRAPSRAVIVHFQGPWADESRTVGDGALTCAVKRGIERLVYRRADAVVVLSRAFRRILLERYPVAPWDVQVVPAGVDLDRFRPGDRAVARRALGIPVEGTVILSVRRLVPRMGLDVLLRAFLSLKERLADTPMFVIVGEGPERSSLQQLARDLGLEGVVHFAGRVADEALVAYYQAADVTVVPSVALEGYGLVVLESLASGTPVVATRVGGLSEALMGLPTDLVVPPGDADALAARLLGAMTGILPLPSHAECRSHATRLAWAEVARRHMDLYSDISRLISTTQRDQRLKVALVEHVARLSGGELAIQRTLAAVEGIAVHAILAEEGPLTEKLEDAGISVEVLPLDASTRDLRRDQLTPTRVPLRALGRSAVYVLRLALRLRRIRPDLVHTNSLKAALYGGFAARLAGVPCVWHIRDRIAPDYLPGPAVALVKLAARFLPAAIVANSGATLATVAPRQRNRWPRLITAVIPSPVVAPARQRHVPSPERSTFRAVMVGRLAPWKGQDVFLRAFARAFPEGPEEAVLVGAALFGEDGYAANLVSLAQELGIWHRVVFRGFQEDVYLELAAADALVHASIVPEPFGQVVVEGMAAGLAVVATRAGGPAEILVDGVTGFLYNPGDEHRLADLLRLLAADPLLRERLGASARAESRRYSQVRVATELRELYEEVLAARSTSDRANV